MERKETLKQIIYQYKRKMAAQYCYFHCKNSVKCDIYLKFNSILF